MKDRLTGASVILSSVQIWDIQTFLLTVADWKYKALNRDRSWKKVNLISLDP